MHIEHIALWTTDIERCKGFYARFFGAIAGVPYKNVAKGFESCFLSFKQGARIEVMKTSSLSPAIIAPGAHRMGLTHMAFSAGSIEKVNELTQSLRDAGYSIVDGPRHTGDGYYESAALDPDGNRIEITK
jgi:lactoylglutathione lyase